MFLQKMAGTFLAFLGLSGGGLAYAHYIEPKRLDIHVEEFYHPLIPPSFDGMSIVLFSDTHIGFQYTLNQLQNMSPSSTLCNLTLYSLQAIC